jgi:endonuclease/exonuclease/phosphatase family metal-dependent hydrolase
MERDTVTDLNVMTWNVENLFLPQSAEGAPSTQEAFDAKIASLAAVINHVAPDVLALQEIGSGDVLAPLQALLNPLLPHRAIGQPDTRGIRVAFLSRLPLVNPTIISAFPVGLRAVQVKDGIFDDLGTVVDEAATREMGRGALHVTVDVGGTPVTVVTAHFKSKLVSYARQRGLVGGSQFAPNDEGERLRYAGYALFRRAGDAMTVRDHLDTILTGPNGKGLGTERAVVFCGDLNDEPDAATTQIINGPPGSEVDLSGGSGFRTPDKGDGFRMFNLAPLIPADRRFSRVFNGRRELIDHIFASHRLVNPGNLPTVTTIGDNESLPSIDDNPNGRKNAAGSDHAALHATFTV